MFVNIVKPLSTNLGRYSVKCDCYIQIRLHLDTIYKLVIISNITGLKDSSCKRNSEEVSVFLTLYSISAVNIHSSWYHNAGQYTLQSVS